MRGLYSHSREYRKIFSRRCFPYSCAKFLGNSFSANTCCACICTCANTGKYSWRIIYVLVSCQGVCPMWALVVVLIVARASAPRNSEQAWHLISAPVLGKQHSKRANREREGGRESMHNRDRADREMERYLERSGQKDRGREDAWWREMRFS